MKRKLHFSLRSVSVCVGIKMVWQYWRLLMYGLTRRVQLEQLIMLIAIGITFTIAARIV